MKTLTISIPIVSVTGVVVTGNAVTGTAGIANGEVRYTPNSSRSNGCFRDILSDCY